MKFAFATLFLVILGLALSELRAQPAAGANALPTTQEIQQALDAKQYPDVLKQSQRLLSVKGPAAKDIDRYDVLLLRAEAQLQLKQQAPAIQSYNDAVKATDDPTKQGLPKAMVTLLQHSPGFKYTPKPSNDPTHPTTALNILDDADRKSALKALFDDEWKPKQAQIESLKKRSDQSLAPVLQASAIAGEMRGLELAATGSDTETSTALSDLTDNAAKLMTSYLDRASKRVDSIDTLANRPQDETNTTGYGARVGLSAAQNAELKDIIATCQKLQSAASQVGASAGSKDSDFKSIAQRAEDIGKRANDVLTADYSGNQNPNANEPIQRGGQQTPYNRTPMMPRTTPNAH
jgi:hypothetical protein